MITRPGGKGDGRKGKRKKQELWLESKSKGKKEYFSEVAPHIHFPCPLQECLMADEMGLEFFSFVAAKLGEEFIAAKGHLHKSPY